MADPKRPSRATSTEEAFFQRRLASLPALQRQANTALPAASAPSLDELVITAPAPRPVTPEELMAFAEARVRERSPLVPRKRGDRVQLGDEVVIDVLGYADGKLIPFSARGNVTVEVGVGDTLPWLDEALVECSVGDGMELPVTLPDDYTVESLRGVDATFLIDVTSAGFRKVPDPQSLDFAELLGPAKTLDDAMNLAVDALEAERVAEAWDEARELVIDELVRRTEVSVPVELVDEEVRRTWQRVEAPYLLTRQFEADEQKEALEGWLSDGPTRLDAERRLRLALGLKALAEQQRLTVDAHALALVKDAAATEFQLADGKMQKAQPPEEAARLALHLRALRFAFSRAKVRFEGVEGLFPLLPSSGA